MNIAAGVVAISSIHMLEVVMNAQYHEPLLRSFMIEAVEATRRTLADGDVEPAVLTKKLWNLNWDPIDTRGIGERFSSSASNTKFVALLFRSSTDVHRRDSVGGGGS